MASCGLVQAINLALIQEMEDDDYEHLKEEVFPGIGVEVPTDKFQRPVGGRREHDRERFVRSRLVRAQASDGGQTTNQIIELKTFVLLRAARFGG